MTKWNPLFEWDVLKPDIWVSLIQTEKEQTGKENMYTAAPSAVKFSDWMAPAVTLIKSLESSRNHISTIIRKQ